MVDYIGGTNAMAIRTRVIKKDQDEVDKVPTVAKSNPVYGISTNSANINKIDSSSWDYSQHQHQIYPTHPTSITPQFSPIQPHQYNHTNAPPFIPSPEEIQSWGSSNPSNYLGPVEGVDELCQMLGVSPTEETSGLFLVGKENQRYSLVAVIAAQLEMMQRLHVLLVHRDLTPESGE
jgi:hypothetical protein